MNTTRFALRMAEKGWLPDRIIRGGIRWLCAARLREIGADNADLAATSNELLLSRMERSPIAVNVGAANEQHYELPPDFFARVLGPRMKYSACWWGTGVDDLIVAEEQALQRSADYADLKDGQDILELGCGWGSLTLWMAQRYPTSRILAASNSSLQRTHIQRLAFEKGLRNVEVVTCDMNRFVPGRRFDRVVSIEMFEHMRNWTALFKRVHGWMHPGGRLYLHIFCHRSVAYLFEAKHDDDWMSRHYFTGGMMPSDDLALRTCKPFRIEQRWTWDGTHYARTAEAWLRNLDANSHLIAPLFSTERNSAAGASDATLQRWRIFFMACAELFGYRQGREWWVSHYRFARDDGAC